ncbi:response regulator transcription factor [Aminomonas paucivorans]|uniref:Two component transcriptional regulator, winged helix family n=1 Tax=Aminomonas paucivorans DSM 12260 TaxID=584708 RepID=E3CZM5_9BACT|nr:response regulator transcription factor [Aminomonas paucivorans]EFQ24657.1 two component transcriptional regulator, winged helix family [Aminomonas paucivorans DSM 12260]
MPGERILVVEDERSIADLVAEALRRQGYRVETAGDGDQALEVAETTLPDLVILDLMLPKLDGWEVCRRLREEETTRRIPIIMLTARRDEKDVVAGLELGADDYLRKPFSLAELLARVKAHLRARAQDALGDEGIAVGPLTLEPRSGEVLLDGTPLDLSPVEYRLLETLVRGKGRLVSREELLAKVWGYVAGDTRTVDVHIFRLRRKIEPDPEHPRLVHTVRGRGYRLLWTPEDRR